MRCVLLVTLMLLLTDNTQSQKVLGTSDSLDFPCYLSYYSPYHETVKEVHGIAAEMLKMRYLC